MSRRDLLVSPMLLSATAALAGALPAYAQDAVATEKVGVMELHEIMGKGFSKSAAQHHRTNK